MQKILPVFQNTSLTREQSLRIQKLPQRKVYNERTVSKVQLEDIPSEAPCQAE